MIALIGDIEISDSGWIAYVVVILALSAWNVAWVPSWLWSIRWRSHFTWVALVLHLASAEVLSVLDMGWAGLRYPDTAHRRMLWLSYWQAHVHSALKAIAVMESPPEQP